MGFFKSKPIEEIKPQPKMHYKEMAVLLQAALDGKTLQRGVYKWEDMPPHSLEDWLCVFLGDQHVPVIFRVKPEPVLVPVYNPTYDMVFYEECSKLAKETEDQITYIKLV